MSPSTDRGHVLACPECEATEISPRSGRNEIALRGTWHCHICTADFDEPDRRPPKTTGGTVSLPGGTLASVLDQMDPDDLVTDGGQDVGELATRLIEVREELQDIGEHVEQLEIRDREVLVEIFDDQAELCLQLPHALEVRAPFDPQDHKLDDDRVLTDGGVDTVYRVYSRGNGGSRIHRDPECRHIKASESEAVERPASAFPDWVPRCSRCWNDDDRLLTDGGGSAEEMPWTLTCDCGHGAYFIKWEIVGSDVDVWAECCDCGRPTSVLGDGRDRQLRWLNKHARLETDGGRELSPADQHSDESLAFRETWQCSDDLYDELREWAIGHLEANTDWSERVDLSEIQLRQFFFEDGVAHFDATHPHVTHEDEYDGELAPDGGRPEGAVDCESCGATIDRRFGTTDTFTAVSHHDPALDPPGRKLYYCGDCTPGRVADAVEPELVTDGGRETPVRVVRPAGEVRGFDPVVGVVLLVLISIAVAGVVFGAVFLA